MRKNIILTSINTEKLFYRFSVFLFVAFSFSIFFNLHILPFGQEEPRRALVALEMLFNNNYIATTIFDKTFYDHPPLWNIILAFSAHIFGYNSEFAFRFPSALSFLITGIVIFFIGKKYVSLKFGILSAFYYLISVDIYFFFSATAEIDIFFSLLILLSILSVFHFYEKRQFNLLFVFAYLFGVLGFLTKGVAALAFVGITLFAFFLYKKEIKRLFSLAHISTAIFSIGIIILYFYWYYQYEDVFKYIEKMWGLTSSRTLMGNKNNELFIHLFVFPARLLANLFPATLFILFAIDKQIVTKIKSNRYILFLFLIFAANFVIYLISPGARARYTYMFYPMVISILVYFYTLRIDAKNWEHKTFFYIINGIMFLLIIACFIIPFISYFDIVPHLKYMTPLFGIIFILVLVTGIKTRNNWNKNLLVICFFIIARILFTSVSFPMKAKIATRGKHKQFAKEIFEITKKAPLYLLSKDQMNEFTDTPFRFYDTASYLEMYRKKIITKKSSINKKGFYISNVAYLENQKILYDFKIGGINLGLIKKE